MARICNDEWGCFGVVSGHDRKALSLSDPTAKITVVTHANGVDFLLEGAKDANNATFAGPVAALVGRGVKFEVCEITLKNRNLKKDQFIQEAEFTLSGVVRITKLQKMGFAYIRT